MDEQPPIDAAPKLPPIARPPAPPRIPRPQAPRKSGRGWMWLAIILGLILVGGWVGDIVSGALEGESHGRTRYGLTEVELESSYADEKIALIQISGVISSGAIDRQGNNMVNTVDAQLRLAAEDHRVIGVLLHVDSPGGEVLASDEIYKRIEEFRENSGKPVVASMGSLAASGGYYVSAPCDWIVANELSLTGSIGVIMSGFNYRGLMDKVGITPMVFKSGRFKDMLSSAKRETEITQEERQMVQDLVDETYVVFKKVVSEGRASAFEANEASGARKLAENWADYADGRVFSGKQAYEHGFVDELGNLETAFERVLDLAAYEDAGLITYRRPMTFGSLFSLFGETEARTVTVDLGVDIPRLKMGHLYFLPPMMSGVE